MIIRSIKCANGKVLFIYLISCFVICLHVTSLNFHLILGLSIGSESMLIGNILVEVSHQQLHHCTHYYCDS